MPKKLSLGSNLHLMYGQISSVEVEVQKTMEIIAWDCCRRQYCLMNHFFGPAVSPAASDPPVLPSFTNLGLGSLL
tara:strand:+ start:314 stop:538 length:225 start_codon:yes stop_codon:yes gene_type:complete